MTAFLLLLALIVVVELVSGARALRGHRSAAPPPSHPDWTWGDLPSAPYSTSH